MKIEHRSVNQKHLAKKVTYTSKFCWYIQSFEIIILHLNDAKWFDYNKPSVVGIIRKIERWSFIAIADAVQCLGYERTWLKWKCIEFVMVASLNIYSDVEFIHKYIIAVLLISDHLWIALYSVVMLQFFFFGWNIDKTMLFGSLKITFI